jgi:hypothetical protein
MRHVETRLAVVESRIEEHAMSIVGVREALQSLEERMDRRFDNIDVRFVGIDQRLDGLDAKLSRHFTWLVGLYVTTLIAIVAALIAR